LLYFFLLIRIATAKDSHFKTPFYFFFTTTAIYGFITIFTFAIGTQFILTQNWAWVLKLFWVVNHIGAYGSTIGKLIIVVHRYSVLKSTNLAEN
ncbi:hypothetical protein PFISCL1PPCAC_14608, partial [Pristionchus fissidentatus]